MKAQDAKAGQTVQIPNTDPAIWCVLDGDAIVHTESEDELAHYVELNGVFANDPTTHTGFGTALDTELTEFAAPA